MSKQNSVQVNPQQERQLMADLWSEEIKDNPYNFVMYALPWGKKGTPLENLNGPRSWQKEELLAIAEHIHNNKILILNGKTPKIFKSATSSGRGVGKSALTSWLILWAMSCHIGGTVIVTANSEGQLKSKTWAEVGKWHTLLINSHWFEKMALSIKPAQWLKDAVQDQLKIDTGYYYAEAQLWSEEKPDAFAGAHNPNGMLVIFDEASGIPQSIWGVTEGFFTEPTARRFWFVFSNPRRNTGAFFECFHKQRNLWRNRNLDSRTVEGTDRDHLQSIIDTHGEDSYDARVEVRGLFPKQAANQFISRSIIDAAANRQTITDGYAALVMGVDPARFGDDKTVIRFRQGRDARSIPPIELSGADNMAVANKCAELIDKYNPDAVFIDAGNGTGIIDRLKEMKYQVHEVWFGSESPEPEWGNMRTYVWAKMRDWLGGGCIDNNQHLIDDLASPEYKFLGRSDKIILQSKEEMKKNGFASPDNGDALALTFTKTIARRDNKLSRSGQKTRVIKDMDYKIFG